MADDKKGGKPPSKSDSKSPDPFTEIIWMGLVVFIGLYFLSSILLAINSSKIFSNGWKRMQANTTAETAPEAPNEL